MDMQGEEDLIAIIKMQPVFGKYAHLVWAYLELFNIIPMKAKTKKIRIILEEMSNLFKTETFNFQKKTYRISLNGISDALNVIVHRHFDMPLKSHGYLKSIMIGISEREGRENSRQSEKDLRKKEEGLMAGNKGAVPFSQGENRDCPRRETDKKAITEEQRQENLHRLGDIIKRLG